jgi:hypothetical protein
VHREEGTASKRCSNELCKLNSDPDVKIVNAGPQKWAGCPATAGQWWTTENIHFWYAGGNTRARSVVHNLRSRPLSGWGVGSDGGSREGLMENSIIMKKKKIKIFT